MADDTDGGPPDRRTLQVVLAIGAVLALGVAALAAWWVFGPEDTKGESCTLTATVDAPTAADPEAAFAAWFAQDGVAVSEQWAAQALGAGAPAAPTVDDYSREGVTEWSWALSDAERVKVDVAETAPDEWAVTGANLCGEAELG